MNVTTCSPSPPYDPLCFSDAFYPFYYTKSTRLHPDIPDTVLTMASPVIAYWALSLFFHALDMSGWKWLDRYRIHEAAEVKQRNLVSRTHVVLAVIFQQVVQTTLGLLTLPGEVTTPVDHVPELQRIATFIQMWTPYHLNVLRLSQVASFVYWWGIPAVQLFFAMFIIDTWQYFLHRWMHVNKWLYKHFHSWHHRLYVPYAFGSLYNHPVEGFVLDSCGALAAEIITRMTTRQAMFLFTFSTLKTVDDHCGYNLPFDPLQLISGNNANYHDIHHQTIGIKSNFAQPFFIHWDTLLGTRMTREDIEQRRKKVANKDQ
ncbi:sphingosine hydroxylase [Panaeolus papilionaceus]|nr:sphingosine hydroxylase [Panaeolus papilionaceus]